MTGGTSPTVFLVAFVVYIAVMIFIGWYSSRGKSEGTDYLTGGRGLNLLMIFGTIGATMIGTGSSMGAISNGFRSGWGGSTTTVHAFCGDGYYTAANWGSPSKTSCTFGVSGGKLTGLPALNGGTLLVVRGI